MFNKKLILASLLCLGVLVGCGGNDTSSSSNSQTNNSNSNNPISSIVVSSEAEASKETSIETVNYGTVDNPITIQEARSLIGELVQSDDDHKFVTSSKLYVKGTITSIEGPNKYHKYEATISFDNQELKLWNAFLKDGVEAPQVGSEVIVSGYGQNFKGEYQLATGKLNGEYDNSYIEIVDNSSLM